MTYLSSKAHPRTFEFVRFLTSCLRHLSPVSLFARLVFAIPLLFSMLNAIIDGILSVAVKVIDTEMFQLSSKRKLVMVLKVSSLR